MYIIVNKNNHCIVDTLQSKEIVDISWVRMSGGSLIQLDMVDVVEVESVPVDAIYYKNGKCTKKHPDEIAKDVVKIQEQLDALDRKSSRDAEDLFKVLKAKGVLTDADLHKDTLQRFNDKKLLCQQLQEL